MNRKRGAKTCETVEAEIIQPYGIAAIKPHQAALPALIPHAGEASAVNAAEPLPPAVAEEEDDPRKHAVMTLTEAVGLVTRIVRYFPNWPKHQSDEETAQTLRAWAEELAPLGGREEVWREVQDFLRVKASPWPPGIFELRKYVSDRLWSKRGAVRLRPPPVRGPGYQRLMEESLATVYKMLDEKTKGGHGKQNSPRRERNSPDMRGFPREDTRMDGDAH